jgi:ribosomal protein L7/L12
MSIQCRRGDHVSLLLWLRQESEDKSRLTDAERSLALDGQKIPAIKALRQRTGLGLKEANTFWNGPSNGNDNTDRDQAKNIPDTG